MGLEIVIYSNVYSELRGRYLANLQLNRSGASLALSSENRRVRSPTQRIIITFSRGIRFLLQRRQDRRIRQGPIAGRFEYTTISVFSTRRETMLIPNLEEPSLSYGNIANLRNIVLSLVL